MQLELDTLRASYEDTRRSLAEAEVALTDKVEEVNKPVQAVSEKDKQLQREIAHVEFGARRVLRCLSSTGSVPGWLANDVPSGQLLDGLEFLEERWESSMSKKTRGPPRGKLANGQVL